MELLSESWKSFNSYILWEWRVNDLSATKTLFGEISQSICNVTSLWISPSFSWPSQYAADCQFPKLERYHNIFAMTRHSEFPQIFLLMNLKEKPLKGERSFWFLLSKSLSKSATVFFRITRSVSENENEFKSQRKNYLLVS